MKNSTTLLEWTPLKPQSLCCLSDMHEGERERERRENNITISLRNFQTDFSCYTPFLLFFFLFINQLLTFQHFIYLVHSLVAQKVQFCDGRENNLFTEVHQGFWHYLSEVTRWQLLVDFELFWSKQHLFGLTKIDLSLKTRPTHKN